MPNLGPFDRDRILEDITPTQELIDRTEYLVSIETDPTRKASLMNTLAALKDELQALKDHIA
jgi:hypothetical protein